MARVAGVEVSTEHWIGGEAVASRRRFADRSPIDGSELATVAAGGQSEVNAAVAAARAAFPAWAALGAAGRAPLLARLGELLRARAAELAAVETADNGSLLLGNLHRVVPRAAHNVEYFAKLALELGDHVIESDEVTNHVRYDPAGVTAIITPWNAPLMLTTWKLGPALAAGNTAVIKPPEWAPLTCSLLAELARQAGIPAGVVNVVQGIGEEAGAALVAHDDVDRVSFTGSTDTGRLIGATAGRNLVPVSFELGGKSPFVVFADADLDAAAQTIAMQYLNAGQVCLAGTRILVERSIADPLLDRVRTAAAGLRVGDPREPATRVGPLIAPEHFERVAGFVDRALASGAEPVFGGKPHPAGALYWEPTLLRKIDPHWEIFRREVFGPVLTWNEFASEDECLELANATDYGLAAMIFTRDERRAWRVGERVVAGTVWVNCYFVRDLAAPFGGSRESGIGREGGRWSFDFFCDVKNLAMRKGSFA
jgi:acyl-CoA reductase-like NAD-dependent aldehyde dehydrogenase